MDHPEQGSSDTVTLPEQGQLVEVRRRQFVVADVSRSALPTDGRPAQHLITLASIELKAIHPVKYRSD